MSILVTGGAGFIGSHLSEALLRGGRRVVCLDNFDPFYDPQLKWENVAALAPNPRFVLEEADIRDRAALDRVFRTHAVEAVIHLAAKAGVRPSILEPGEYFDVNVQGTLQVLEAMRAAGCRRLLLASSSSVYGNQEKRPFSETDDVSRPISPYAASKRSAELLAHSYHHLFGIEVACLRLFTVYGPRQRPDLAIHKFTRLALQNQPIPLFGDGRTLRDYTFVEDIVQGFTRLLDHPGWGYEIFNLGYGSPVTLLEMVEALEAALERPLAVEFLEKQPGDVEQTHADISKASRFFGYRPAVALAEGVRRFVEGLKVKG
jgi:UDP-glucuronate 4-epimerase